MKKRKMNLTMMKEVETMVSRDDANNVAVMVEEVNRARAVTTVEEVNRARVEVTAEGIQGAAGRDLHQWILKKGAVFQAWAVVHLMVEAAKVVLAGEDLHRTEETTRVETDLRQIMVEATDPEVHHQATTAVLLQEEEVMAHGVDLLQWIPRNGAV